MEIDPIKTDDIAIMEEKGFRKWAPLVVLSLALLIIVLDTTLLNVSLRAIIGDLGTTIVKIQWVITAYSLTLAAFTITGGRLGDLFGRKKIFIIGAVLFAIGSFIASISHSVGVMIMGEAIIEGIGAAMMMPATSSLLVSNYRGRDRQIAFGVWGGIAAAGAALGPVLGGWLTTYYSWRWAFRLNVFVVIVLLGASFLIHESKDRTEKAELDWIGVILSSLGLFALVFSFIEASTYGWWVAKKIFYIGNFAVIFPGNTSIVTPVLVIGLELLFAFMLWENRREKLGHTPLVSMSLFKNSQFTVSATTMALLALSQTGMSFAIPVFFQSAKNLDAFHTGLAMLPMSLSVLVAAPSSAYMSKFFRPKRIIQAGLILCVLGFVALIIGINSAYDIWALTPGFILFGCGMGFMFSQSSNMTLSAVSVEQSGEASGVNGTMRTVGATLGAAILGAILLSTLTSNLINGVKNSSVIPEQMKPNITQVVNEQTSTIEFGGRLESKNGIPDNIRAEIKSLSIDASAGATRATLLAGIGFIILAFFLSFKLPGGKNIEQEKSLAVAH